MSESQQTGSSTARIVPSARKHAPSPRVNAERRRLTFSLLLSLLAHALLLSLALDGDEFGVPGFVLPWQERRGEMPNLNVVLQPAQIEATEQKDTADKASLRQESIAQTVVEQPTQEPSIPSTPSESSPPTPEQTVIAIVPKAMAKAEPDVTTNTVTATAPLQTEGSGNATPVPPPEVAVIAVERSDEPTFSVPPPTPAPVSVTADASSAPRPENINSSPPRYVNEAAKKHVEPEVKEQAAKEVVLDALEQEVQRQQQANLLEAARAEVAKQEAARVETARLEAERKEATQQAAAKLEAQRQETAQQEATRVETARLEADRQTAAKLEAQRQEAAQREASRQDAARADAARIEADRREAARQAAEQMEAQREAVARQEAARAEAARLEGERLAAAKLEAQRQEGDRQQAALVQAEKDEDARRLARRQAIGRQLNAEADQRAAAARAQSTLPYSLSTARRGRLWGRADPNAELVHYAEAWARKIQLNTLPDTVREITNQPHTDPTVAVSIRSDGSVESITFVLSSGVTEVDDAIRRIIQSHLPYQAFPPGLARQYDVVEIRRTWYFDVAVRLY